MQQALRCKAMLVLVVVVTFMTFFLLFLSDGSLFVHVIDILSLESVKDRSLLIMMPVAREEFVTRTQEQKDALFTFTTLHEGLHPFPCEFFSVCVECFSDFIHVC